MNLNSLTRKIFLSALQSVKPEKLVTDVLHRHNNYLVVNGKEYSMKNNVYVIGFGKAVYGMAVGLQEKINDHIANGYLSVPDGFHIGSLSKKLSNNIHVMCGAENNIPDNAALLNAMKIKSVVESLSPDDILIVLISGGGSALLPLPIPQIDLNDKVETIKVLVAAGGNIEQLNTVRTKLSQLKGGKLAYLCRSNSIIALIVSDIVNDPLHLIASGPTVQNDSTISDCLKIISELKVYEKLPAKVKDFFKYNSNNESFEWSSNGQKCMESCNNILIGNNMNLVASASMIAREHGFKPFLLSRQLQGSAADIGILLAKLAVLLLQRSGNLSLLLSTLSGDNSLHTNVDELLMLDKVCIIAAGETTVEVKGTGRGGRNQHLVLSALNHFRQAGLENPSLNFNQLCLLSAGSDGQDGPTDAAGALCDGNLICCSQFTNADIEDYLKNCGSHDFFTAYSSLDCCIKTGLTGINVMDMQLILIDKTR